MEWQVGRSWKPVSKSKNGHTNFRLVCIRYFRDKYVVFARNYKLANMI